MDEVEWGYIIYSLMNKKKIPIQMSFILILKRESQVSHSFSQNTTNNHQTETRIDIVWNI